MEDLLTIAAFAVSLLTLLTVVVQTRLLRKSIEATNYQDLLGKLAAARDTVIHDPQIAQMFTSNSELQTVLRDAGITVPELFWILKYLTTWENFYQQRKIGVMSNETWTAYIATISLVFKTPKIRTFWERFRQLGTYRKDWVDFVNHIVRGEEVRDPKLAWWRRLSR